MRIGIVTTSYPREPGDPAGSFVAEHAAWLARAGHEVEVIAAGPGGASDDRGIPITRVAQRGLFYTGGAPEALASQPRSWLEAARFSVSLAAKVAARARRWDRIIAHWLAPSAAAACLAGRGRIPVLAVAHSGDVHLLRRTGLVAPMAELFVRTGARTVFVSDELRRLFVAGARAGLRRELEARALVSPMGVDVERIRAVRGERAGCPPAVLFLGRLVPVKGVEFLLGAAARWRCGARLIIAGTGPRDEALRRAARDLGAKVEFAGEVRGHARDRLLREASCVVLPSVAVEGGRTEGLPLALLEAMAAQTPVIASHTGGMAELPRGAVTWVRPRDSPGLARAVDKLLADPARRRRQLARQESLVREHRWSVVGPRLLTHLEHRTR